jgi:small RNA 2'-O-methyltransferase
MTSSSISGSERVHDPLPIYFSPPLYDQRRLWVMSILRQEGVSSILDVGCGDGNLLACLCNPPPWLSEEGRTTVDPSAECQSESLSFVDARRLVGLDISRKELVKAVECTAPEESTEMLTSWSGRRIRRWDSLEVTILEGNFADYNPKLCDVECIVATEVYVTRVSAFPSKLRF